MSSTDYRVLSVASVWYPIYCRPPVAKLASATRGHRQPTKKSELSCIIIGFGWSPSVPGLQSCHFQNHFQTQLSQTSSSKKTQLKTQKRYPTCNCMSSTSVANFCLTFSRLVQREFRPSIVSSASASLACSFILACSRSSILETDSVSYLNVKQNFICQSNNKVVLD